MEIPKVFYSKNDAFPENKKFHILWKKIGFFKSSLFVYLLV
jgi:hypothetical protein